MLSARPAGSMILVSWPVPLFKRAVTLPFGSLIESRVEKNEGPFLTEEKWYVVPSFHRSCVTPGEISLRTAPWREGTEPFVHVPSPCFENGRKFPFGITRLT